MKPIYWIRIFGFLLGLCLLGLYTANGQGVLLESTRPGQAPLPMVDRRVAEMAADRGTIAQGEAYGMLRQREASSGAYRSVMLYTPSVGNQGSNGSCVGFAVGYAAASILAYPKYSSWSTALRSPAYVYNQIRIGEGCDSGAYISDALRLVTSQGICSYRSMPYVVDGCRTQPLAWQRDEAYWNRILRWGELSAHVDTLRWALSLGYPVVVDFRITQSFYDMWGRNGVWRENGRPLHGDSKYHAVCVVGFDDALRMFKVQNSWGSSRGDKGFFWVSYDLVAQGVFLEAFMLYGMTPDPEITGPDVLCTTATYTIAHLQMGDRVEWETSPAIEIVEGQGSGTLAVRKRHGRGEVGWISASVNGHRLLPLEVQVGFEKPHMVLYEGRLATHGMCAGRSYTLRAYGKSGDELKHVYWSVDGLGFGPEHIAGSLHFTASGGSYRVRCWQQDAECGMGPSTSRHFWVMQCGGDKWDLLLSPNPAGSTVTLHLPPRVTEADGVLGSPSAQLAGRMVRIYSQHAELMYEGEITDGMQLDVRGWPRGAYTVMVDGRGVQTLVVE